MLCQEQEMIILNKLFTVLDWTDPGRTIDEDDLVDSVERFNKTVKKLKKEKRAPEFLKNYVPFEIDKTKAHSIVKAIDIDGNELIDYWDFLIAAVDTKSLTAIKR